MDRKGANTFPFYKSTSRTESNLYKEFFCAFVLPFGENKRRWRLLLPATFREPALKQSVLFPPHHSMRKEIGIESARALDPLKELT